MRSVKAQSVTQYILHKQHLLESARSDKIGDVVNDILALHATSATTPYLSLFARMKNFRCSDFDREFHSKRNLIRLELMRGTLFITTTALAPLLFQATKLPDSRISEWIQQWGIPGSEYQRLQEYIFEALKEGGKPLSAIKRTIPPGMVRTLERQIGKNVSRLTNVNLVLTALMRRGRVFSEKFSEPILTRYANRYGLVREAYPQLRLDEDIPTEAQLQLIKQYIGAFGPVCTNDIAWWTGFTKTITQATLEAYQSELRTLRIKKLPDDYFMLESDYTTFKKTKLPRKSGALLLPYEDPYTKGYKIRTRLISPAYEDRAYIGGEVRPTVLFNGKIIGVWNRVFDEQQAVFTIQLFERLSKKDQTTLIHQANALGAMMNRKNLNVEIKTH